MIALIAYIATLIFIAYIISFTYKKEIEEDKNL